MPDILNQDLIAGTTLAWSESISDFPSSDYTAKIILKRSNDSPVEINSEASETEDAFDFAAGADETATLPNGDYLFQYIFTAIDDETEVYAPKSYSGVVHVDVLLSSAQDTRSHDQIVYDALCDAEIKIATRDYVNVSINGKAAQFKSLNEILAMKNLYARKLGMIQQPVFLNAL